MGELLNLGGRPWCWGPETGARLTVGHRLWGPEARARSLPFCSATSPGHHSRRKANWNLRQRKG